MRLYRVLDLNHGSRGRKGHVKMITMLSSIKGSQATGDIFRNSQMRTTSLVSAIAIMNGHKVQLATVRRLSDQDVRVILPILEHQVATLRNRSARIIVDGLLIISLTGISRHGRRLAIIQKVGQALRVKFARRIRVTSAVNLVLIEHVEPEVRG